MYDGKALSGEKLETNTCSTCKRTTRVYASCARETLHLSRALTCVIDFDAHTFHVRDALPYTIYCWRICVTENMRGTSSFSGGMVLLLLLLLLRYELRVH